MAGILALIGLAVVLYYASKALRWLGNFLQALALEIQDRKSMRKNSHEVKSHNTRQQAINAVKPSEVSDETYNRRVKKEIEQLLDEVRLQSPK